MAFSSTGRFLSENSELPEIFRLLKPVVSGNFPESRINSPLHFLKFRGRASLYGSSKIRWTESACAQILQEMTNADIKNKPINIFMILNYNLNGFVQGSHS